MPLILRVGGFRLFFYANEGSPRDPIHVHVERGDQQGKFWVQPEVMIAYNDGFDAKTLQDCSD